MPRPKHRHSRAAHNAPEVSHSNRFRSARLGPHSRPHVYLTHTGSYPQVAAPSAAMAEVYTTPGPSASQHSTSREKSPHPASPSPVYGVELRAYTPTSRSSSSPERRIPHYFGTAHRPTTTAPRSSSSPERHIPHYFGITYRPTHPSGSSHRSHSNKEDLFVDYRRDSDHLHGESRSSARDQPHLDNQAGSTSENREIFEPNEYIRAWQGTLQTAIPPNAFSTSGLVPTGPPDFTDGRPQTRQ